MRFFLYGICRIYSDHVQICISCMDLPRPFNFIPLLTGFGGWSFCSASPCLTGLSLSNCWHTAHRVPDLPIHTCSSASCATKLFHAGKKKEKIYIEQKIN